MHLSGDPNDFRARLKRAVALGEHRARLEALTQLAAGELGMIETIQLDRALAACPADATDGYATRRLALLSSHTIDHLQPAIRVAGLRYRLRLELHLGTYGQYRQQLLQTDDSLLQFRPDLILLSLNAAQATAGISLAASASEVERTLDSAVTDIRSLWRRARETYGATPIQQTCLDTSEPLFGSLDRLVAAAPSRLVARFNELLAQAASQDGVLLLDLAQVSARDGLDAWFDTTRWLQGKMEVAPQAAPRYGELVARLLGAREGRSRKCLVLDLDDTVWGGVIGDVGVDGIVLGEGSARGEAHLALQRYAKSLRDRGVILAVCSKNDPVIAEAGFRDHPEMVLRREDIAAFVANWNDKAENLVEIARRLNVGLDSMVFVDDSAVERARVRESLPMVAVPELPTDPALYVRSIARGGYFEAVTFTEDDRARGDQYAGNSQRDAARTASSDVDGFLRGLEMVVSYGPVPSVDLARVTQLINKTNQFNTTTKRYSAEEVERLAADPAGLVLQFRLLDRFGDNGLVSVIIFRPSRDNVSSALEIDNWVMSCRVFGRQLEREVMNIAVQAARERGIESLYADFIPTQRNGVISNLFADLGFVRLSRADGALAASRWSLALADYSAVRTHITRKGT